MILDVGSRAGLAASIHEGYYLIGRHAECQIRPKSKSVSRRHCLIHHAAGNINVMDLDSTTGTIVNSTRLAPRKWRKLNPGDEIRLGKVVFKLSVNNSHRSAPRNQGGAIPSGDALHDFDVAGFLDAQDNADRENRYQNIRAGFAEQLDPEDDGLELPEDDDFDLPGEDPAPSNSPLAPPQPDVDDSLDSLEEMFADPEVATAPPPAQAKRKGAQVTAKPANDRAATAKQPAAKSGKSKAKPPAGKAKPKRSEPKIPRSRPKRPKQARSRPSVSSLDAERLKLIGAIVLTLVVLSFFGYRVYRLVSPPEVQFVEELKY